MNWQAETEEHRFVIEYEVERICFGSPGRITEWVRWGAYRTAEERDAAIERLRKSSDARNFRARDFLPWENRRIAY